MLAILAAVLAACALIGCRSSEASGGLPVVEVQVGSKTLTLEVANTPDSRQTGLMKRDSMPAGHGMLFVFPVEEPLGFYMKNTRIPLDIIFLDASRRVVSIATMKPYDLRTTPSAGPAKYAIEVNAGVAKGTGVKVGDTIDIPQSARETSQ